MKQYITLKKILFFAMILLFCLFFAFVFGQNSIENTGMSFVDYTSNNDINSDFHDLSESDSDGSEYLGNVYKIVPKFRAESKYDLTVYDKMMEDVNLLLSCSNVDYNSLKTCLKNKISELNEKRKNEKIMYEFDSLNTKCKTNNDCRIFYDFVNLLYKIRNSDADNCKYAYN